MAKHSAAESDQGEAHRHAVVVGYQKSTRAPARGHARRRVMAGDIAIAMTGSRPTPILVSSLVVA